MNKFKNEIELFILNFYLYYSYINNFVFIGGSNSQDTYDNPYNQIHLAL